MLTSTGFDVFFAAAGNLYLLLMVAGVALAIWKGRTPQRKAVFAVLVVLLFVAPILPEVYRGYEYRQRYAKAKALFDERCKTAGETIYRTVDKVDGLLVVKPRPKKINLSDQYELDDPYGRDFGGDDYITSFLMGRNLDGTFTPSHTRNTYKFVEIEAIDKKSYQRFLGVPTPRASSDIFDLKLKQETVSSRLSQYGVNWADLSTKEDRDQWIAGSLLEIVDLRTNQVVAQRIGYMFDRGLGDRTGGRSPWAYAERNACPAFEKSAGGYPSKTSRSRGFVLRVLQPVQGE